jgi:hypothetical protein
LGTGRKTPKNLAEHVAAEFFNTTGRTETLAPARQRSSSGWSVRTSSRRSSRVPPCGLAGDHSRRSRAWTHHIIARHCAGCTSGTAKANGWTPERWARQANAVHRWKPGERSARPTSVQYEVRSATHGFRGGQRALLRELSKGSGVLDLGCGTRPPRSHSYDRDR